MRDKELEEKVSGLIDSFTAERKKQGLSHEALANKCGLHRSTISLIESKKRMPSILVCMKIAKALNIKLAKLV